MAVVATPYEAWWKYVLAGDINITDDDIYLALLSSSYTPDAASDAVWADVSTYEITGTGYTAGGALLSGKAVSLASAVASLAADNVTWASLTATFRYAVLYAQTVRHSITNPLIGYLLLDSTPADVNVSGVDYSVIWNESGILTLQAAA